MGEWHRVIGQRRRVVARAASSGSEVGILERCVGPEEDVHPQQWIRVAWVAGATGIDPLGANANAANRVLIEACGHSWVSGGIVLEINDIIGVEAIALEITQLAEASRMVRIAPVSCRDTCRASSRVWIGTAGHVENQQRLSRLSHGKAAIRVRVQPLVPRRIVRDQQGRPEVNRLAPEEAEVCFHLGELIGVGR